MLFIIRGFKQTDEEKQKFNPAAAIRFCRQHGDNDPAVALLQFTAVLYRSGDYRGWNYCFPAVDAQNKKIY